MRRWEEDVTVRDLQVQRLRLAPGRCLWCDYDLAGLAADAVCPECGKPCEVEKALPRCPEKKLLRHAPPAWRRRVVLGVRMLDWAGWLVCGFVGAAALWLLFAAVVVGMFQKTDAGDYGSFAIYAMMALAVGGLVLGVTASWLVTTPPPEGGITLRARLRLRWSAVFLGVLQLAWVAPSLFDLPMEAKSLRWVGLGANVLAAIWGWSLLRFCARLEWHTARWTARRMSAYSAARGTFSGLLALVAIGSVLMSWFRWSEGMSLGWEGLFERPGEQSRMYGQLIVLLAWILWSSSVRVVVPAVRGEHRAGAALDLK